MCSRLCFLLLAILIALPGDAQTKPPASGIQLPQLSFPQEIPSYANAQLIVGMPLQKLRRWYPLLKHVQTPPAGTSVFHILTQFGENITSFSEDFRNVTAIERIQMWSAGPVRGAVFRLKMTCRYVVETKLENHATLFSEYRTDLKGRPLNFAITHPGQLVSEGFTTSSLMFARQDQASLRFRLLGQQPVHGKTCYALAYAERPGSNSPDEVMWNFDGHTIPLLTQGIVWVNSTSFQPQVLISELLAPQPEIGLTRFFSQIWYEPVTFPTIRRTLWLPNRAKVVVNFEGALYVNLHRYSDYQLFHSHARLLTHGLPGENVPRP